MIAWLRGAGRAVLVALAAFGAAWAAIAAARHRGAEARWRQRVADAADPEHAVGISIDEARAAHDRAETHGTLARQAEARARDKLDKIGESDESMADLVDRWRRPADG